MSENRRSPLNALVVVVLFVAAIALLPVWRPVGAAGVPAAVVTHAPQGIATNLRELATERAAQALPQPRVWNPQTWGSWLEWAVPEVLVATDSRVELFPRDLWVDANQLAQGAGEWMSILDEHGADVVVVAAGQDPEIVAQLEVSPAWSLRYQDADGSIWTRIIRVL